MCINVYIYTSMNIMCGVCARYASVKRVQQVNRQRKWVHHHIAKYRFVRFSPNRACVLTGQVKRVA